MLMHIDKPLDRYTLEVICNFADKRQTEIELYTQDEGFEYALRYMGKVYEVTCYKELSLVASLQGDIMHCNIICDEPDFLVPRIDLDVVSMQTEVYDYIQIIWTKYLVKINYKD